MFGLGIWEVLAILIIALFLFGHRLPGVAQTFGSALRGFRKEVRGLEDEVRSADR